MKTRTNQIIYCLLAFQSSVKAQYAGWKYYSNGTDILSIAVDGTTLWIGKTEGLARISILTSVLIIRQKSNSGLSDNPALSIAIDDSVTNWMGTQKRGLSSFDGTIWINYDTANFNLPDNQITSIVINELNTKSIGTMQGGVDK